MCSVRGLTQLRPAQVSLWILGFYAITIVALQVLGRVRPLVPALPDVLASQPWQGAGGAAGMLQDSVSACHALSLVAEPGRGAAPRAAESPRDHPDAPHVDQQAPSGRAGLGAAQRWAAPGQSWRRTSWRSGRRTSLGRAPTMS